MVDSFVPTVLRGKMRFVDDAKRRCELRGRLAVR